MAVLARYAAAEAVIKASESQTARFAPGLGVSASGAAR
jgi:hypothetical protein